MKTETYTKLEFPTDTISIRWLTDKYANFKKDKIYTAVAMFKKIDGSGNFTNYRIKDEDGDYYTLPGQIRPGKNNFEVCGTVPEQ